MQLMETPHFHPSREEAQSSLGESIMRTYKFCSEISFLLKDTRSRGEGDTCLMLFLPEIRTFLLNPIFIMNSSTVIITFLHCSISLYKHIRQSEWMLHCFQEMTNEASLWLPVRSGHSRLTVNRCLSESSDKRLTKAWWKTHCNRSESQHTV